MILNLIYTKKYGNYGKEYEFIESEIDDLNCILTDPNKKCSKKSFHYFDYRCASDIEFTNMEKKEVISTIIIGYRNFKSQF